MKFYIPSSQGNQVFILLALVSMSCLGSCHSTDTQRKVPPETLSIRRNPVHRTSQMTNVNLYIENSGSMNGYLEGNDSSGYKTALGYLYEHLSIYSHQTGGRIAINFINSKIFPDKSGNTDFINWDPHSTPFDIGGDFKNSSKLDGCLKLILDSLKRNSVSVFISDCIYSVDKRDTKTQLGNENNTTWGAFTRKLDEFGFSTIIVQLRSKFTGNYYYAYDDKTPPSLPLKDQYRPYYIWIIVPDQIGISNFLHQFDPASIPGFQNIQYLMDPASKISPYYTILPSENAKGRFHVYFRNSDHSQIQSATSLDAVDMSGNHGPIQFAVGVDLRNLPINEAYKLQTGHYKIYPEGSVSSVELYNEQNVVQGVFALLKNYHAPISHFLTIELPPKISVSQVSISYPVNQITEWVGTDNSNDDRNMTGAQLNKTFGLQYLINGVTKAYKDKYPNFNSLFSLTIGIN